MKINNLKVKKGIVATMLGLSVITLTNKNVQATERNEIETSEDAEEKDYLLFQKCERNSKDEEFTNTYIYYAVPFGKSAPVGDELTSYIYLGNLDVENFNRLTYTTVSNNYMDCAFGNFISEDKICKECYQNVEFVSFDDTINKVVSSDGTVLGYTPKKKILVYSENYIYR